MHKTQEIRGLFKPICGGIQIDLNTVLNKGKETSLCNHNCTSVLGGYDCPASFTLNKGTKPNYAPLDKVLEWLDYGIEGIRKNRRILLDSSLIHAHAKKFNWDTWLLEAYIENLLNSQSVEINAFGGNPEMYPWLDELIGELKKRGTIVNLTTTGRRFLKEGLFINNLPDHIALSIDDITTEEFNHINSLDIEDIKKEWAKINPLYGQKQKAYEAIYTLKLLKDIPIIINCPVHPGNIDSIFSLYETLKESYANILFNPYPFQSAFMYEKGDIEFTEKFKDVVEWALMEHAYESNIVQRLHYWVALKSIYLIPDPQRRANLLAGEAWHCAKTYTGYIQMGQGNSEASEPGGKLGCFWNTNTVTKNSVITSAEEVSSYIMENKYLAYKESLNPCRGCLMPRLTGDVLSLEQGLHPELINNYLRIKDIF